MAYNDSKNVRTDHRQNFFKEIFRRGTNHPIDCFCSRIVRIFRS